MPRSGVIDHGNLERRGSMERMTAADPIEKGKRLVVAACQHVLPVVDALSRRRVAIARGAAAKLAAGLDYDHARATLRESGRR